MLFGARPVQLALSAAARRMLACASVFTLECCSWGEGMGDKGAAGRARGKHSRKRTPHRVHDIDNNDSPSMGGVFFFFLGKWSFFDVLGNSSAGALKLIQKYVIDNVRRFENLHSLKIYIQILSFKKQISTYCIYSEIRIRTEKPDGI